ncbi:MAG: RnfH family protein [Endozoicomonadaceae bacterium]|nr:RnfH family protein [Endozoicomonadaceae bacterium]
MNDIMVEIIYALPDKLYHYKLMVSAGTTVTQAIEQSDLLTECRNLSLQNISIGIFGKKILRPAEHIVEKGDRIEIYRPIITDPKLFRKKRIANRETD